MAIEKMSKFAITCMREDKNSIIKSLQSFGGTQLINLQTESNEEKDILDFVTFECVDEDLKDVENRLANIKSSKAFLNGYIPKVSIMTAMREGMEEVSYSVLEKLVTGVDINGICQRIKSQEVRLSEIDSQIAKLKSDLEIIEPWCSMGETIEEYIAMKTVSVFMGEVVLSKERTIKELEDFISNRELSCMFVIDCSSNGAKIVVVSKGADVDSVQAMLKEFDFIDVVLPCSGDIKERMRNILDELSVLANEKNSIADVLQENSDMDVLNKCEEYYANLREQKISSKNFLGSKNTMTLSGWIPLALKDGLGDVVRDAAVSGYSLSFEEVSDLEEINVPIKLKNNSFVAPFESITEMYSLPNYKGLDPTPLLAPFYMLFFGMMVGDFGYGAIITIACILAMQFFNLDDGTKNFAKLFMYLGISTTGWGLIYGAGFGDAIQFNSILDMNNDIMTIMVMSIGFGVVQILVALGIKAYICIKAKNYFAAFADVGLWIITFVGIAMFAMGMPLGKWIMISGMLGILLTNGRDAEGVAGKLGSGAYALYGITNYVGDLVSYTRLMALGVAGGSIASAMNLIIGTLPSNIFVTFIIVPLLFIAVHIFNLLLGALGAYVHSCRLQYVEYFGKFYDGSGEAFSPFKTKDKNLKVK